MSAAYLMEIAEKVDALGRECADSVNVVTTGGEVITFDGTALGRGRRRRRAVSGPRLLGCSSTR
jgi:hypothetical protein